MDLLSPFCFKKMWMGPSEGRWGGGATDASFSEGCLVKMMGRS